MSLSTSSGLVGSSGNANAQKGGTKKYPQAVEKEEGTCRTLTPRRSKRHFEIYEMSENDDVLKHTI